MTEQLGPTTVQRLRAAVESAPSGLLMVDAGGSIVLVNREVERLFGYPREELLGKRVEMLVPEAARALHPDLRAGFLKEPRVRAMGAGRDLHGRRKDGSEVPVEIGLNPVVTEEGVFVLGSIVDITARKRAEDERRMLEEQLRQSQRVGLVGTLAGGVAHDFNNILGAIVGYAELVRARQLDAASRADMDGLLAAAGRGRRVVERILQFSRGQTAERRPLDLATTVRDATQMLRPMLPAAIEVRFTPVEGTPRVLGDATAVHQILLNLATNAAHAMPQGGAIEITLDSGYMRDSAARQLPDLHEGAYVVLSVADGGNGMTDEVRAHAFEPFFTTKESGAGSGLGLAIVRRLVLDHGGAIGLESRLGAGTKVTCYFPALESDSPIGAEAPADTPRGNGERVLFVDDEPVLADVCARRLQSVGYAVTTLTDPLKAVETFAADPDGFDVVVTDYSMPHMSGEELARRLTAVRPGVPVVLATGNVTDIAGDRLSAAGIRTVLQKPLTLSELATALHALLAPR